MTKLRILVIGLMVLALMAASVAVYALTYKTVPFDLTVTQSGGGQPPGQTANFDVFTDNETTLPLTALHWGNVAQGSSATTQVWVKNIGTATGNVTISANNPYPWGSLDFSPSTFALAAGAVQQVELTVSVSSNATVGSSHSDTFVLRD